MDLTATLDRCTQCGLCLPYCPTYRESRLEHDSPRGRVWSLLQAASQGLPPGPEDSSFWGCTSCGLCVDPCPTGVDLPGAVAAAWDVRGGPVEVPEPEHAELPAAVDPAEAVGRSVVTGLLTAVERRSTPVPLGEGLLVAVSPWLAAVRPEAGEQARELLRGLGLPVADPDGTWSELALPAGGLLRDAGHTTVERQAAELLRGATPAGRTVLLVDLPAARLGAALAGADAELRTLPDYLAEHRPGAWKFEPDPDLDLLDTHQPDESWLAPLAAAVPGRGWRPELLPLDHAGAGGPDIRQPATVNASRRLVGRKQHWLGGRGLLTADPRSLLRHPGARFYLEGIHRA